MMLSLLWYKFTTPIQRCQAIFKKSREVALPGIPATSGETTPSYGTVGISQHAPKLGLARGAGKPQPFRAW